ncbi:MAG: TonB-dependent receptor, partial [Sphingomonadales bacterium]|nr:TonB-dependent receptor [Sphingomonadales bacterium]
MNRSHYLTASAAVLALSALNSTSAIAQEDGRKSSLALEEIVVTGSKTGETLLQRTPIAITALSTEELEASFVTEIDDITLRVPGLITGGTTGFSMPLTLRGITSRTRGVGADPAVSVYVDGVPFGRSLANAFDLFDIAQIEVLRGPQGTLWGRNSIGGAVSIKTKRPSEEFGAYLEGSYGNFNQKRVRASIDGPIVSDEIAAKLSFTKFDRDGFQDNLFDDRDLNDRRSHTLRGSLLLTPSDSLEVNVSGDWAANNTRLAFGTLAAGVAADPDVVDVNADNTFDIEQSGLSTTVDYDLGDLGDFTSATAFRRTSMNVLSDSDSTGVSVVEFHAEEETTQFSQEFRLNGEFSDRLQWLVGVHYFHEAANINWRAFVFAANPVDPTVETFAQTITNSYAAFGQAQYQITDNLRASVGLRYTYDKKDLDFSNTSTPPTELDGSSGVLTPRFALDYQATDDVLIYASASRGYNSGGFSFT